ncbi:MAG TPA: LuxR C-terminal-related transcriptional regulator, partial [Gaiellaceae bacterium]
KVGLRGLGACAASPDMERMTVELRRGRLDAADDLRRRIDELTAGLSDVQQRGTFHMLSAELALEQERPDEAHAQIEQALALAATTDDEETTLQMAAIGVQALAEQSVDAGSGRGRLDPDKLRLQALELSQHAARLLQDRVDRGGDVPRRFEALAAMCEAERSRMHTSDPELWARAAQHWETAGEPHPHAYCLWRQADALLQRRAGRAAATACLQQAGRISREIGARSLADHIELLARRARILLVDAENAPANGSTVAEDLGLTPREVEVLAQLASGHTDREIADALFISKKTASVHVSNLLRKLDVANRVEAGRVGQMHLS